LEGKEIHCGTIIGFDASVGKLRKKKSNGIQTRQIMDPGKRAERKRIENTICRLLDLVFQKERRNKEANESNFPTGEMRGRSQCSLHGQTESVKDARGARGRR